MSLIEFISGELAKASDMNNNFQYLDSKIGDVSTALTSATSDFSSQVAALNTSVENVLEYTASFVPTGGILAFGGDNIPTGYLECDGSEVRVSDYEDLYDVIGTTFGSSDSTTFCLPDLVDKTVWGAGLTNFGDELVPKLPNIYGTFRLAGTEGSSAVAGMFSAGSKGGSRGYGHEGGDKNPLMVLDASTTCSVYTNNFNSVQPPAIAVKFIIKY